MAKAKSKSKVTAKSKAKTKPAAKARAKAGGYPAFQCFKANDTEYCSAKKLKSHAEGSQWIATKLKELGIPASSIQGKPYLK
jgi:hypothetical protein